MPAGPIGTCWLPGSWSDTCWRANSWANATVVPVADFTGSPLSGLSPLVVSFADHSTNSPTSWAWEKSDDGVVWVSFAGQPAARNPSESFGVGTWSVRLTASNSAGSDTKTRTDYVTVTTPTPGTGPASVTPLTGTGR